MPEDPVQILMKRHFGVDPEVMRLPDIFQRLESLLELSEVLFPSVGHRGGVFAPPKPFDQLIRPGDTLDKEDIGIRILGQP